MAKRTKTEIQKRNGGRVSYVRMTEDMYEMLEELHHHYIKENQVSKKAYGMSTLIRDMLKPTLERRIAKLRAGML